MNYKNDCRLVNLEFVVYIPYNLLFGKKLKECKNIIP